MGICRLLYRCCIMETKMRKSLVVYFSLADEQNKKGLAVQGKVAQTNKNTAKKAVQDWLVKFGI